MPTVLSTKKLTQNQKELLLNTGISLVEYNAITIDLNDFTIDSEPIKNAIITSKNAAQVLFNKDLRVENCFCVGEKTADFLTKNGFFVAKSARYGADLAKIIVEEHSRKDFVFFCGNKRRDELPKVLEKNNINFEEIQVYNTRLNVQQFQQEFDGIMFFSPSAVKSYTQKNDLKTTTAFCIGKTTAAEAKKHTQHIRIASKPSIENVIVQVVKEFKAIRG